MDRPEKYLTKGLAEGVNPLCPICGEELAPDCFSDGLWECGCGESIPKALAIDPMKGGGAGAHGPGCVRWEE